MATEKKQSTTNARVITWRIIRICLFAGILLIGFVFIVGVPDFTSFAQQNSWSEPYNFPMSGWFPDIAADQNGQLHVVWSQSIYLSNNQVLQPTAIIVATPTITITPSPTITDSLGTPAVNTTASPTPDLLPVTITNTPAPTPVSGFDVVYYSKSQDGNSWSEVKDIIALQQNPTGSVEVTRPQLLISPDDIFHMTFRDIQVYYSQAPLSSPDSAKSWHSPYLISQESLGYFSQIAQGNDGRLHLVYTENVQTIDCNICYHVFYRFSDDNGNNWSGRTDISMLPTGSAKPQILIDDQNFIHVVWESGPGGTLGGVVEPVQILYSRSTDNGATWSEPVEFTDPDEAMARNISIEMSGINQIIVVWLNLSEDKVYYSLSTNHGQFWSIPRPISDVWGEQSVRDTRQNNFAMIADGDGNVHLVIVGRLNELTSDLSLIHLTWNNRSWSEPDEIITYKNGGAPEWPRLAISNGNLLNLVWFIRPREHIWDANPNYYSIWYSNRRLSSPFIAPQVPGTSTATISPVATSLPSTLTPSPTVALTPVWDQTLNIISSENDDLQTLIVSLVPSIALLIVLVIIIRKKHRKS